MTVKGCMFRSLLDKIDAHVSVIEVGFIEVYINMKLGGGFNFFCFHLGEMIQFDTYFLDGWLNLLPKMNFLFAKQKIICFILTRGQKTNSYVFRVVNAWKQLLVFDPSRVGFVFNRKCPKRRNFKERIPSRELTYPTSGSSENHVQAHRLSQLATLPQKILFSSHPNSQTKKTTEFFP